MEHRPEKSHRLYPVALDVQYKILCRGREILGEGRTTWIGSKELVFVANAQIPSCERIEVSLPWPAALEDGIRLKLVIRGRVSDVHLNRITVAIVNYEFHTRAAFPKDQAETLLLSSHIHAF